MTSSSTEHAGNEATAATFGARELVTLWTESQCASLGWLLMALRRTHPEEFRLPLLVQRTTNKQNYWEGLSLLSSQEISGPTFLGSWASHFGKWHLIYGSPAPRRSHPPDWEIRTSELPLIFKTQLKSTSSDPPLPQGSSLPPASALSLQTGGAQYHPTLGVREEGPKKAQEQGVGSPPESDPG